MNDITHVFLFRRGEVVGQTDGVVLVDLGGDSVEPCDESVLDPVHKELGGQHHQAVGREGPKTLCKAK